MRWILAFLACGHLAVAASAQGQIDFRNDFVNGQVFDRTDTVTKLEYPWLAQLYAGPDGAELRTLGPVGAPAPFGLGVRAGYWDPSPDAIRVVPGVAPGQYATVMIKAWYSLTPTCGFECSLDAGGSVQVTEPMRLQLGGDGLPPAALGPMSWILPEPTPAGLGALALGLWGVRTWLRRQRAT
jgi:hypothetical protein